jgi:hypothetical protein
MMDALLYWNRVALEANRVTHSTPDIDLGARGPAHSARALGIVHLAMHDAYAAIINTPLTLPLYDAAGYGTVPPAIQGAAGAAEAALVQAAHDTLKALHPSQVAQFTAALAAFVFTGTNAQQTAGRVFGGLVATNILAARAGDPSGADAGYIPPTTRTGHREDPDYVPTTAKPKAGFYAPFYGEATKCFASPVRYALDVPPRPGEAAYLASYRQVRSKGIKPSLTGTLPEGSEKRTSDETVIGTFWAYDGVKELGTPPRLYNQIVREIAIAQGNSLIENIRLFALINIAMTDAGVLAWEQKYLHNFWRPVQGVREHDPAMGTQAQAGSTISPDADPSWLPLGAPKTNELGKNFTPNFPAYPSGHATFGAACFHMVRMFYGVEPGDRNPDKLTDGLSFVSDEYNGSNKDNEGTIRPRHVRSFENGGLWQMIVENGLSRVYLGVHWSFDAFATVDNDGVTPDLTQNIGGVALGLNIAEGIFNGGRARGLKKV